MNEITAAIRKKAEEKYPHTYHTDRTYLDDKYFGIKQSAYTCGGEDAIKFFVWANKNGYYLTVYRDDAIEFDCPSEQRYYSFTELLLKYIENNKL